MEWYGEIDFQTNSEAMRESMRCAPIHQCVPMIELPTGHDDTTMKITSVDSRDRLINVNSFIATKLDAANLAYSLTMRRFVLDRNLQSCTGKSTIY